MDWLESYKIPVGKWAAAVVDWMTVDIAWFFDGLAEIFDFCIKYILIALQAPPPLVTVAIFALVYIGAGAAAFGSLLEES